MIKDFLDLVDFASSFLEGTALLWFLSSLESRRTFGNWGELKESLSATFGPLDKENDDQLNPFSLTYTGPLNGYIQDFSRLTWMWPPWTSIPEHYFLYGDFPMACLQTPCVITRELYQKLFVPLGQPAEMRCWHGPRNRLEVVGIDEPWTQLTTWLRLSNRSLASNLNGRSWWTKNEWSWWVRAGASGAAVQTLLKGLPRKQP